jgi:hypothetical protein
MMASIFILQQVSFRKLNQLEWHLQQTKHAWECSAIDSLPDSKRPLGRPMSRWENMKLDIAQ